MLVADLADDGLDDVLDGHETVGATVFVDDQRHLDVGGLHLLQQVGSRHGGRHEQQRADEAGGFERHRQVGAAEIDGPVGRQVVGAGRRTVTGDVADQILDVDHADGIVQRLAVDRHARMAGILEGAQQIDERDRHLDGGDVGARHHDVGDARFAQAQNVADEPTFLGRERRVEGVFLAEGGLKVLPEAG